MDCSTPGFPVQNQLTEFAQTHTHWVGDAIQPPYPLLSPSPPASGSQMSQLFSNESALRIRWPKYWSFSFNISPSNEQPGLISFRMDWLDLLAVQGTLKSLLQHHKWRWIYPCVPCVLSRIWLFVAPWTVACQASLSMEFSRQEYWVAISYSRGSFQPRDQTCVSCISCIGRFFTSRPPGNITHPTSNCLLSFYWLYFDSNKNNNNTNNYHYILYARSPTQYLFSFI